MGKEILEKDRSDGKREIAVTCPNCNRPNARKKFPRKGKKSGIWCPACGWIKRW